VSGDPDARILERLRGADAPVSGEELADMLRCSRAAVWKRIAALREQGYRIEAHHAAGYVLAGAPDRVGPSELAPHLRGGWRDVRWLARVDSTQQVARDLARDGAAEGTAVVAEEQTAGRGRLGRTWHSPAGENLYCSVVLRPPRAPGEVPQIALVAGIAVAAAVEEATGRRPAIKWPNDVLLDGKKVAGILTEMESELDRVHHVIAGIGVNLNTRRFPRELRDKASSLLLLTGRPVDRARFAAAMLAGAGSALCALPGQGVRGRSRGVGGLLLSHRHRRLRCRPGRGDRRPRPRARRRRCAPAARRRRRGGARRRRGSDRPRRLRPLNDHGAGHPVSVVEPTTRNRFAELRAVPPLAPPRSTQ
jgi:BirA family biotin operon repressor/biotin-[acetyl-CoA-carboxylase] ligase